MRSSEKRVRRLRLLIMTLLAAAALVSAAATLSDRLHLQLWGSLTVLLTVLAVLAPTFQGWLKQAQALIDRRDQQEEDRAKQLADRARADVLEQVRREWVQTELRRSLYEQARIDLGLAERPAAVDNPLRAIVRRPDEPDHLLQQGQPIVEVYRQLGKQLLILGDPGAGKTTLLMELTDRLLDEAEAAPNEPMPVVFHLSTWVIERRPFVLWLVDQLYKGYGVPRRLGQMWVDTDQVIPLLDGLDEVVGKQRDACVAAINTFHNDHGLSPLVVCSRITEYEAMQAKLRLRGAIVIQLLSRVEVEKYLRQAGRPLAGVRAALRGDEQLRELLTTPLFLSIVALTYRDKSAAAVRAIGSMESLRQRVLDDYIEAMLSRPRVSASPRYPAEQTVSWLTWLARAMQAHGQSVFYLDWMQPDWLPTPALQWLVPIGVAVAVGLSVALAAGLVVGLSQGLLFGLWVGLPTGLLYGISAFDETISPTEQLRWSATALQRRLGGRLGLVVLDRRLFGKVLIGVLVVGLVGGLPAMLVGGLRAGLDAGLLFELRVGLVGGLAILVGGVLSVVPMGLRSLSYVTPPVPGKAIQRSRRNALVSGLGVGLFTGLLFGLVFVLVFGLLQWLGGLYEWLAVALGGRLTAGDLLPIGLFAALASGLFAAMSQGGGAYLRHHLLRWLLIRNGFTPRDYVAFLEHASQLILLRRRGGGYEFVHRLLLERFAALEPHSGQVQVSQRVGRLTDDGSQAG